MGLFDGNGIFGANSVFLPREERLNPNLNILGNRRGVPFFQGLFERQQQGSLAGNFGNSLGIESLPSQAEAAAAAAAENVNPFVGTEGPGDFGVTVGPGGLGRTFGGVDAEASVRAAFRGRGIDLPSDFFKDFRLPEGDFSRQQIANLLAQEVNNRIPGSFDRPFFLNGNELSDRDRVINAFAAGASQADIDTFLRTGFLPQNFQTPPPPPPPSVEAPFVGGNTLNGSAIGRQLRGLRTPRAPSTGSPQRFDPNRTA